MVSPCSYSDFLAAWQPQGMGWRGEAERGGGLFIWLLTSLRASIWRTDAEAAKFLVTLAWKSQNITSIVFFGQSSNWGQSDFKKEELDATFMGEVTNNLWSFKICHDGYIEEAGASCIGNSGMTTRDNCKRRWQWEWLALPPVGP